MVGSGVGLMGNNGCLSLVKMSDFSQSENGFSGKSISSPGSRSRAWRSMVAKNEKRFVCVGELKKPDVAASALSVQVNGKTVTVEEPSAIEKALLRRQDRVDPKNVASIILGEAPGDHLFPLTSTRAACAVRVGGCYRLIDIPMSNCINSGIRKIVVLTQFNSTSLNRHISRTYSVRDEFGDGFIEVLAATQSPQMNWFQGTADAVRQFAWMLEDHKSKDIEYVIILSGDQFYRMDFMKLVQKHADTGARITMSCVTVDDSRASDYGLMKVDENGCVIQFQEKPKDIDLEAMKNDNSNFLRSHHQSSSCIASMGVYVFNKSTLLELLNREYPKANDFGSQILPYAVEKYDVQAYLFEDYWENIGTIKSFFDANLALTDQPPKFQFYDPTRPIITTPRFLPPIKIEKCRIIDSLISHGCFLHECSVEHSIVGIRSRIDYGAQLKDTVMTGSNNYETEEEIASLLAQGKVPMGVGENTQIRNCIIDLNARIGKNVVITNKDGVEEADRPEEGFYIRSGITIVPKNATIKDGTVI